MYIAYLEAPFNIEEAFLKLITPCSLKKNILKIATSKKNILEIALSKKTFILGYNFLHQNFLNQNFLHQNFPQQKKLRCRQ